MAAGARVVAPHSAEAGAEVQRAVVGVVEKASAGAAGRSRAAEGVVAGDSLTRSFLLVN